jgi:curved DNA-binding protein CbpA
MSLNPSIYIPVDIYERADKLIHENNGESVRKGIELILKNDLSLGLESALLSAPPNSIDGGAMLQSGLALLANAPHEALDIKLGAQTIDVRKAYKKMALKYHPDKNPTTTPLFQAIQSAHERLSDKVRRREEEEKATKRAAAAAAASRPPPPRAPAAAQAAYRYQPNHPSQTRTQADSEQSQHHGARREERKPEPRPNASGGDSKRGPSSNSRQNAEEDEESWSSHGPNYRFQEAQRRAREREQEKQQEQEDRRETERQKRGGQEDRRKKEFEEASRRAQERREKAGYASAAPKESTPKSHTAAGERGVGGVLPAPSGLKALAVDSNTVELSWNPLPTPLQSLCQGGLKVELSWREWISIARISAGAQVAVWENSATLLSGERVRKKNLLPNITYEFRIRYVLPASIDKKSAGNNPAPSPLFMNRYNYLLFLDIVPPSIRMCIYICVCMFVCMCVCLCV